jgi:hypothetical protein
MGLRISKSIDTRTLSPELAQDVVDLIESSNFFQLPGELLSPQRAADRFQYKITISDDEHDHTVQAGEAAIPEQLWPLVQVLDSLSRANN